MVLGLGMNKIVFPTSAVGVGDGNHFAGDLLALDNERNTPAVPLTSKPRDHLFVAFCCRFQNKSGFSSKGLLESVCLGKGMGVVRSGGS